MGFGKSMSFTNFACWQQKESAQACIKTKACDSRIGNLSYQSIFLAMLILLNLASCASPMTPPPLSYQLDGLASGNTRYSFSMYGEPESEFPGSPNIPVAQYKWQNSNISLEAEIVDFRRVETETDDLASDWSNAFITKNNLETSSPSRFRLPIPNSEEAASGMVFKVKSSQYGNGFLLNIHVDKVLYLLSSYGVPEIDARKYFSSLGLFDDGRKRPDVEQLKIAHIGESSMVHAESEGTQSNPDIVFAKDGRFLVTWLEFESLLASKLLAQKFTSNGVKDGKPSSLTKRIDPILGSYDLAVNAQVKLVTVVNARGVGGSNIYASTFSIEQLESENDWVLVNSEKYALLRSFPNISTNDKNNTIVVWTEMIRASERNEKMREDGHFFRLRGQRLDGNLNHIGEGFSIDSSLPIGNPIAAVSAIGPDGSFVVAWQAFSKERASNVIMAKSFDKNGSVAQDEIVLSHGDSPSLLYYSDNKYLLTWQDDEDVFTTLYEPSSSEQVVPVLVSEKLKAGKSAFAEPTASVKSGGDFTIVWGTAGTRSVAVRHFDSALRPKGAEFLVDVTARGGQYNPAIAINSTNSTAIAWTGEEYNKIYREQTDVLSRFYPDTPDEKNHPLRLDPTKPDDSADQKQRFTAVEPAYPLPNAGHKTVQLPNLIKLEGGDFEFQAKAVIRKSTDVVIEPFEISDTELTIAEWQRFTNATGYVTDAEANRKNKGCLSSAELPVKSAWIPEANWKNPGYPQALDHPVVCISLNDIWEYISWLNRETNSTYRLPTVTEWEYAALAAEEFKYSFGNDGSMLCDFGNGADQYLQSYEPFRTDALIHDCDDGSVGTAPIKSYKPNKFGLYDFHGNVWEWADTYEIYNDNIAAVDTGPWQGGKDAITQTERGGSWSSRPYFTNAVYHPGNIGSDKFHRTNETGFRLARSSRGPR